ncbi:MAG: hypothetical protein M3380_20235, partial [Chloroflexota bacterium]|nr:hypothetical protein [Chloroflexota bacterium]
MTDLDLLRTYEPIVRFTHGELFFPCAVDEFVKSSSLWMADAGNRRHQLVGWGELDLGRLAEYDRVPTGHQLYLRFVREPLRALEYQRWLLRPDRVRFQASGRLARVPLLSRVADSLFDVSLLVRGMVPGGTAAAADVLYRDLRTRDSRRVYYGRVVRVGGWTVLHYLFFYPMNNWRSGFYGANDHESDWEQTFVYLSPDVQGRLEPQWVAYASHDFRGDDLRRRWDDPLLVKEGTHPVIFVGAGSHANYFEAGEYVMGAEPPLLNPVKNAARTLRKFWVERLGQGANELISALRRALITIPFVDYARGDGMRIGPGQDDEWEPILISDGTPWVDRYRGLWGLDVRDPWSGERAPAGPKYNRDGSVRRAWYDPLGWAGLAKVSPPAEALVELEARRTELDAELAELAHTIDEHRRMLRKLALDVEALRATEHFTGLYRRKAAQLDRAEKELQRLVARENETSEVREAITTFEARVQRGDWGDPHAHLRQIHH